MINFLEYLLLLNLSVFILFSSFSRLLVKITLGVGISLLLVINIVKFKQKFYRGFVISNPAVKYLMIFLLAAIFSTILSTSPRYSQSIFFERYIYYFLFLILGYAAVKPGRNLFFLLGAFMLSNIFIGIGGVWDYLHQPVRLFSSFGRHINLTPYLALAIPLSCALVLFARNKLLRFCALLSLIALFPCLLWNSARAAWVAVFSAILAVSFFKNKKFAFRLTAILIVFFLFLSPNIKERANSIFETVSWGDRIALWKTAAEIFEDFPVLGAGLGMYEKLLYKYTSAEGYSQGAIHLHAHNTYLELASEMGLIGLLAFLSIFVFFFRSAFKSIRLCVDENIQAMQLGLTGSILATLILAFSTSIITIGIQDPTMFWLIFGMAIGLI